MGMLGWGIATAVILIIIICLVFMIRHFYDSPAYSMADESKYRNALCNSVRRDFEGAMEQLLELLDELMQKTRHNIPQVEGNGDDGTTQFYNTAKEIYNQCKQMEKTIRDIWPNPKYTKDFYFFVGLHFASRYLTDVLSAEKRNLTSFLNSCAEMQQAEQQRIDALIAQREETEEVEEQQQLTMDIRKGTQIIGNISNQINTFKELESVYKERVSKQASETNRRAEFIAKNFHKMGPEWKETMSIRARRQ